MTEVLLCECGIYVAGRTEAHAKGNLKQHQKTEQHRNQFARLKFSKLGIPAGVSVWIDTTTKDYVMDDGVSGGGITELRKQLAIINYDKNDEGEEE